MIRLTSMLHGEVLRDLLERWILGRFDPADCPALKRLVNLNAYVVRRYLDSFARDLLAETLGRQARSFVVSRKGQLKDFICRHPPVDSLRVEAMVNHYRRFPEDYYRETPFEGRVYYLGQGDEAGYVLSSRAKRMRRIAEKSARRIVDFIFGEIKKGADELATERASLLGIPKDRLITPVEQQIAEFAHAERRLVKSIRTGRIMDGPRPDLVINDLAGVKIITDLVSFDALREWFDGNDRVQLIEEESHEGRYNATNFVIRFKLDKDELLAQAPDERVSTILVARGVASPGSIAEVYRSFVETADDWVNLEIIAATYEDMLDSEIGLAMHENRIIEQRRAQEYRGHLAKNVEYLVTYALSFAVSPSLTLEELPLRVWVKYMPDTVDDALNRLWGIESASSIPCSEALESSLAFFSEPALHD